MWPKVSVARVARSALFVLPSLCLSLWASAADASLLHRYYCDSEALTRDEATHRINWAWACGFNFCRQAGHDGWTAEQALDACGYPVFNEPVPVEARIDEETGYFICHLDPQSDDDWRANDSLEDRLSRLRLETQCRLPL